MTLKGHIKFIGTIAFIFVIFFNISTMGEMAMEINVVVAIIISLWVWFLVRKDISVEDKEKPLEKNL